MKRILFICSGNMYRSAGAEFILRKIFAEAGIDDWIVDSAGTFQLNRTWRPEDFGRILAEKGYEFGRSQVDICKAFGLTIPDCCAPVYVSKAKPVTRRRGRPANPKVENQEL